MSNPAKRIQEMKKFRFIAMVAAFLAGLAPSRAQVVETVTTNGLSEPFGVAVHPGTNVYFFSSSANDRVVRFIPATGELQTVADGRNGLSSPQGIVYARGGLVVVNSRDHSVLWFSPEGDQIRLAGGTRGDRDGTGSAAQFDSPAGIAADAAGNL